MCGLAIFSNFISCFKSVKMIEIDHRSKIMSIKINSRFRKATPSLTASSAHSARSRYRSPETVPDGSPIRVALLAKPTLITMLMTTRTTKTKLLLRRDTKGINRRRWHLPRVRPKSVILFATNPLVTWQYNKPLLRVTLSMHLILI